MRQQTCCPNEHFEPKPQRKASVAWFTNVFQVVHSQPNVKISRHLQEHIADYAEMDSTIFLESEVQ
jgi:hypothetical protein